jgi:cytochrome c-type biogenesis protein CcmH/NrfF
VLDWAAVLAVIALALSLSASASHASDEPPAWAYAMAHDLMSPFCPGRTLAECPSPQAEELRFWILTQAAAGASQDEIQANLYDRFGDVLRSAPEAKGMGLMAYLLPVGGALAGIAVLGLALRRITSAGRAPERASEAARPPAAASDDAIALEVDREIAQS